MFLTFETDRQRAEFLARLRGERADLVAKLRLSDLQPTIVFQDLTQDESDWLRQHAGAEARIHENVRFSLMT